MKLKIKGALDKDNNYIFPHNGIKKEKYKCPECNEDIIFKKGKVVIQHFSHKANSNCTYYSNSPSESEIHIYAKNILAQWLEEKKKLKIIGTCFSCNEHFINKKIKHKDGDEVIIEYNSPCKKYVADVAIINNGKVRYVLEVTNTHKTIDEAAEARPEPWFDFNAIDIIKDMDFNKNKSKLLCIRSDCNRFCDKCTLICKNLTEELPIDFILCTLCKKSEAFTEPCVNIKSIRGKICLNCDIELYLNHKNLYHKNLYNKQQIEFYDCERCSSRINYEGICQNCNNLYFCKHRKCKNEKENPKQSYCNKHTCNHKNCFNKIFEIENLRNGLINNSNNHEQIVKKINYCEDHICKLNNCYNHAEFDDNGYCINHQNQLIKDENINVCQNWKKGCTYDKYKKNYCRKCFTQYNKKLKESLKLLDI